MESIHAHPTKKKTFGILHQVNVKEIMSSGAAELQHLFQ